MSWFCPTFQRPDRLAQLALSWECCQPETELFVRVWDKDPMRSKYFEFNWPETWTLYRSSAEWCGDALRDFYKRYPNEDFYGFVGDDIILRTKGGLDALEASARKGKIAYPNDMFQRDKLCTHFCIDGDLVRMLGYWVPKGFRHQYLDCVWHIIGLNTGLLRYHPEVIFDHMNPFAKQDEQYVDDTTRKAHGQEEGALKRWEEWQEVEGRQAISSIRQALNEYEKADNWDFKYEFIRSNIA